MEYINKAKAILDQTARQLQSVGAEAMISGQIDQCADIGNMIRAIRRLFEQGNRTPESVIQHDISTDSVVSDVPASSGRLSRSRREGYPRFYRNGEDLVKIGWSKKERKEYEHKAPHSVVEAVARAVTTLGLSGRRFSAAELLPALNSGGREVPDYQGYLALAWLRSLGLVDQHGKQGYTLTTRDDLAGVVNKQWEALSVT